MTKAPFPPPPAAYGGEFLGVLGGSAAFAALALRLGETGDALLVAALSALPHATLLVDLAAGPVLERTNPRRWLVLGALLRGLLLFAMVPLLAAPGLLLILLAFLFHALLSVEELAWKVYLPRVANDRLTSENARLRAVQLTSDGAGDLVGPPLSRVLVSLPFTAGGLLLLLGGLLLRVLPEPKPAPKPEGKDRTYLGFRPLLASKRLRYLQLVWTGLALQTALGLGLLAILVLRKGTPPELFGLVFLALSTGALAGSLAADRLSAGAALGLGVGLRGPAFALLLAPFPANLSGALLLTFGINLAAVHLLTLRQRWAPEGLLARVQAASGLLVSAGALAGAALAGWLGSADPGLPTLLALALTLPLWLLVRRLRQSKKPPLRAEAGGGGGIRTRGALTDTPVFETGPFNRSGTPPSANGRKTRIGV